MAIVGLAGRQEEWWIRRPLTYAGRIADDKGIHHVLQAWMATTASYPIPLWIVGGLPEEIAAVRLAVGSDRLSTHESSGMLHWWGYLDASGVSAVLLRSAALVTHSRYEPGGRVMLEAMAEGVPVIASPHGFARDLVRDWVTGFLVPFGDIAMLQRRMEHFARQPYLRNALGRIAREAALKALDTWRFIDAHCDVYDEAVGRRGNPRTVLDPNLPSDRHFFDQRLMTPTYPFEDNDTVPESLVAAITAATGHAVDQDDIHKRTRSSSMFWDYQATGATWLVKQPYSRVEVRPLWDPSRRAPLVLSRRQRYRIEHFSSKLDGFAPFWTSDEQSHLLIRRVKPQPDLSDHRVLADLRRPLDRLHAVQHMDLSDLGHLVLRSWQHATADEVIDASAQIESWMAKADIGWHSAHHFSLSLSWRMLQLDLAAQRLSLPCWCSADERWLASLAEERLASEALVLCHGSPHARHYVLDEKDGWQLIDGEQLHPGEPEEDLAYLVLRTFEYLSKQGSEITMEAIARQIVASVELSRVVSWCALDVIEGLCRQLHLMRAASVEKYRMLWGEVCRFAAAVEGAR